MTTIAQVQKAVCDHFDLAIQELLGDCRSRDVARARQLAYLACRKMTGRSSTNIGRHFGRDHATVLYGVNRARELTAVDPIWKAHYDAIKGALSA